MCNAIYSSQREASSSEEESPLHEEELSLADRVILVGLSAFLLAMAGMLVWSMVGTAMLLPKLFVLYTS